MLRCSVGIVIACIGCYSIFIAWRFIQTHNITVPRVILFNIKYVKVCAEHILLNFNSAINPLMYILNNISIKRKLAMQRKNSRNYRSSNLLKTNKHCNDQVPTATESHFWLPDQNTPVSVLHKSRMNPFSVNGIREAQVQPKIFFRFFVFRLYG